MSEIHRVDAANYATREQYTALPGRTCLAIVVVGGSGKDIGKTALVCGVISASREFEWTAVMITGHDYGQQERSRVGAPMIFEETRAGEETDTERYLAAGARRALLVTRDGAEVSLHEIRKALGDDRNVIFESNRIADVIKPDICIALAGGEERKPSFERLLLAADAVVAVGGIEPLGLPNGVRRFDVDSAEQLSTDFIEWFRERLTESAGQPPLRARVI